MKTIWKYELEVTDDLTQELPRAAKILSVQVQKGTVCIWALVDPAAPTRTRHFKIVGTGHPIEEAENDLSFIGTFQMYEGSLVFHLFEVFKR